MRCCAEPASPSRRRWQGLIALVVAGLLLLASTPVQALEPQLWTLPDQAGRPWSITLLEQADPAYPGGLRLRLTDRSGRGQLDHSQPLRLHDAFGGTWELVNRSEELVAAGEDARPTNTSQFDLIDLEPSPRAELPLVLAVPLASGEVAQLVAGAGVVAALHRAGEPHAR